MRKWLKRLAGLRESRRAQTTAEYAIIVALVAVSSIAVILIFGDRIRALFAAESDRLVTDEAVDVDDYTTDAEAGDAVEGSIKEWE